MSWTKTRNSKKKKARDERQECEEEKKQQKHAKSIDFHYEIRNNHSSQRKQ